MNNLTQSPALAGTPDLSITAPDARPLLPLLYAKSVPCDMEIPTPATRYSAAKTLDQLACFLLDEVGNATARADDCANRLRFGMAHSTEAQLVAAQIELDEARATLAAARPWYLAMLCGAPRAWYEARRDELQSMLDAHRTPDAAHLFADVDVQALLDALTETA